MQQLGFAAAPRRNRCPGRPSRYSHSRSRRQWSTGRMGRRAIRWLVPETMAPSPHRPTPPAAWCWPGRLCLTQTVPSMSSIALPCSRACAASTGSPKSTATISTIPCSSPFWRGLKPSICRSFCIHCRRSVASASAFSISTTFSATPFDTAIAAAHLMFGGVLDRHPKLQVNLPHAGGVLPILIGRIDHGGARR
jgi:hypothetical protein